MAFPRFYFVAPADLLDILSKGSDPHLILRQVLHDAPVQVASHAEYTLGMHKSASCTIGLQAITSKAACCRHLPKIFDNVHNLEYLKDGQGESTNTAVGMYSGALGSFLYHILAEKGAAQWLS